jgi:hypothetical protein
VIITAIGNGHVACTLSSNESMVLLRYLSLGFTQKDIATISDVLAAVKNVDVSEKNVISHLEAIRVVLDERESDIYTHLAEVEAEVELEDEDDLEEIKPNKKPELIH